MQEMKREYFSCQCSDFRHDIRFTLDPEDGQLWLEVNLEPIHTWYKRVWIAIKYVFGKDRAYGYYDCTLMRTEDYPRLRKLLDKSEALTKAYEKSLDVPKNTRK